MTPGETLARLSRGVFSVKGAGEGGECLAGCRVTYGWHVVTDGVALLLHVGF